MPQLNTTLDYRHLPINQLCLDEQNPRLPEELSGSGQSKVLEYLYEHGVLAELANSFVDNGYFPHEPLIAVEDSEERFRVVEGNRRLASLLILLQEPTAQEADLEFVLDPPPTSEALDRLREIPCVVVKSEDDVYDFLGFRHIGGLKSWTAEAKARYILREIERVKEESGTERIFYLVGRRVGSNAQGIRNPYLALKTLLYARDTFGLATEGVLRKRFGVWTRAMNSTQLRKYIGLGSPTTYEEIDEALGNLSKKRFAEVLADMSDRDGKKPVLSDSRDVTDYAAVLRDERAHAALRKYDDLSIAVQIIRTTSLPDRITRVVSSVETILLDVQREGAPEDALVPAKELVARSRTLLGAVREWVEEETDD